MTIGGKVLIVLVIVAATAVVVMAYVALLHASSPIGIGD
jgi:hypothetical protein